MSSTHINVEYSSLPSIFPFSYSLLHISDALLNNINSSSVSNLPSS
ncbi:hypothetical protein [Brachyspira innocens]|nr:hypothetical protein [Brachyspira innocens]